MYRTGSWPSSGLLRISLKRSASREYSLVNKYVIVLSPNKLTDSSSPFITITNNDLT